MTREQYAVINEPLSHGQLSDILYDTITKYEAQLKAKDKEIAKYQMAIDKQSKRAEELKKNNWYLVDNEKYMCVSVDATSDVTGKSGYSSFKSAKVSNSDGDNYYKLIPHSEMWRVKFIKTCKVTLPSTLIKN